MISRQQAQWVLLAQCGDRDAVERLLASVQPPLTRYVRALVGSRDAEDVAQEVMVTIYRRIDSLLDIPLGTAKSRMAYGLSTLRRHYADGGTGD